jgi:prepilin-type N-terminal cleavage/methylation domain-containing protein
MLELRPSFRYRIFTGGFTLIELLMVISIVAILSGLAFTGVQSIRESSRVTYCHNNLRQLGLGLMNYESSRGSFPTGVYPNYSGLVALLPFLEEKIRYDQLTDIEENAPQGGAIFYTPNFLKCPSEEHHGLMARTSYLGSAGTAWLLDGFRKGIFYGDGRHLSGFNGLRDGASNTVAVSEFSYGTVADRIRRIDSDGATASLTIAMFDRLVTNAIAMTTDPTHGDGWYMNGMSFAYYSHYLPPGMKSGQCIGGNLETAAYTPSSNHRQQISTLRADASVHTVSYSIDRNLWVQLGHREDGGKTWF